MLKPDNKFLSYSLLIILFFSTNMTLTTSLNSYLTKENYLIGALGAITAACIGAASYSLYFEYLWPNKNMINYCRATYKTIFETIELNKKNYLTASSLSDWDLKAHISTNTKDQYPFMAYYSRLTQALFILEKQANTINKLLTKIYNRKTRLNQYTCPDNKILLKTFARLEIQGSLLQANLKKVSLLLILLKDRIALFKEYTDDYHNWLYEQEKNKQAEEKYERQHSRKEEKKENHTPDAFDRTEKAIIQFNLDYY